MKRHERLTQTLRGTTELGIRNEGRLLYEMAWKWSEGREEIETVQRVPEVSSKKSTRNNPPKNRHGKANIHLFIQQRSMESVLFSWHCIRYPGSNGEQEKKCRSSPGSLILVGRDKKISKQALSNNRCYAKI